MGPTNYLKIGQFGTDSHYITSATDKAKQWTKAEIAGDSGSVESDEFPFGSVLTNEDKDKRGRTIEIDDDCTVTAIDTCIIVDSTTNAVTITITDERLADPRDLKIIDQGNAGTNNITIDTSGTATINGDAEAYITADYDSLVLSNDGTNLYIT